jgi:hypothetical protein
MSRRSTPRGPAEGADPSVRRASTRWPGTERYWLGGVRRRRVPPNHERRGSARVALSPALGRARPSPATRVDLPAPAGRGAPIRARLRPVTPTRNCRDWCGYTSTRSRRNARPARCALARGRSPQHAQRHHLSVRMRSLPERYGRDWYPERQFGSAPYRTIRRRLSRHRGMPRTLAARTSPGSVRGGR